MTPESTEANGGAIDHLADAWQRIEWADRDGEAFARIARGIMEAGAYRIWTQRNGDRWETHFHRVIDPRKEAETMTELARLFGSYLEHLRAALNYLTYQLALLAIREDPSLDGRLR